MTGGLGGPARSTQRFHLPANASTFLYESDSGTVAITCEHYPYGSPARYEDLWEMEDTVEVANANGLLTKTLFGTPFANSGG